MLSSTLSPPGRGWAASAASGLGEGRPGEWRRSRRKRRYSLPVLFKSLPTEFPDLSLLLFGQLVEANECVTSIPSFDCSMGRKNLAGGCWAALVHSIEHLQ